MPVLPRTDRLRVPCSAPCTCARWTDVGTVCVRRTAARPHRNTEKATVERISEARGRASPSVALARPRTPRRVAGLAGRSPRSPLRSLYSKTCYRIARIVRGIRIGRWYTVYRRDWLVHVLQLHGCASSSSSSLMRVSRGSVSVTLTCRCWLCCAALGASNSLFGCISAALM